MMFRVAQASNSTLDEVRNMSGPDYDDWCLFCEVEPRDGVAIAAYFGEIVASIYNQHRTSDSKTKPLTAKDIFRSASEELPACYRTEAEQQAYDDIQNQIALSNLLEVLNS